MITDAKRIWQTLLAHHQEILSCLESHRQLCLADIPDRRALTSSRWRVANASRNRMAYLHETVFPAAEGACNAADLPLLVALRDATPAYRRAISSYVTRWTTDAILADWRNYREVAEPFRQTILSRISQEAALLGTILERRPLIQSNRGKQYGKD